MDLFCDTYRKCHPYVVAGVFWEHLFSLPSIQKDMFLISFLSLSWSARLDPLVFHRGFTRACVVASPIVSIFVALTLGFPRAH